MLQIMGLPVKETTTNVFFLMLDAKGEKIERRVYSIWDLLADIGGFKDGLIMVFGGIFVMFDSKWFFIDLNKSLFRVEKQGSTRTRRFRGGDNKAPSPGIDGERIINSKLLSHTL